MSISKLVRIAKSWEKMRRDDSGAVIMIFALFAGLLLMFAAGAIELHRRNNATEQLQAAADAAALAGKRRQTSLAATLTPAAAKAQAAVVARNTFVQMLATSESFKTTPVPNITWNADGSLTVSSAPKYSVLMGNFLPASFANLNIRATADYANSVPTEIAMVLDTTMSMFAKDGRPDTRFTLMRNAAKKFTHQLFNAAQTAGDPNLVRISVVPWATAVNVRGAAPLAADFTGDAPVTSIPDYGSRLAVASPLARGMINGTAASNFAPVQWRGCISGDLENQTSYSDAAQPNWNALKIKDGPIMTLEYREGPYVPTPVTACTCTATASVPCGTAPGTQGFNDLIKRAIPELKNARFTIGGDLDRQGGPDVEKAQCTTCTAQTCSTTTENRTSCTVPSATRMMRYCNWYSEDGRRNTYNPASFTCTNTHNAPCFAPGTMPTETDTAPACVADPNEPSINNNTVSWCPQYYWTDAKLWDAPKPISGPNVNCPAPMLGLSGNRRQVLEYIDRLSPVPGGTHADVGLRWGLRTLAPSNNWPSFFGIGAKPPAAWGSTAQKVMVLITDGQNEQAVDFKGYWGCSRIDSDHDCAGSPDAVKLDDHMLKWCNAIRNTYNTSIYAVAVNFSNVAAVAKLQACTGDNSKVFSVDAASLDTVLASIASKVMAMRLVQ